MDIQTIISTFGFPISCVIGCSWFILKMYDDNKKANEEREDKLYSTLIEVNATNKSISETNKRLVDEFNKTIGDIKDTVDDILDEITSSDK